MTRVELTEQGRGHKNRTCLELLTTCTSVVCLCTLWLGGAGAESCRAGAPPPYTGTDWVSNCSPAEVRNQKSHTTCPRGVRSWQADVVRQSSRCKGEFRLKVKGQGPRAKGQTAIFSSGIPHLRPALQWIMLRLRGILVQRLFYFHVV